MATVYKWSPFGVALDITATPVVVSRTSATQYTVKINVAWKTYYSGASTNYGMTASSGGKSVTINKFGTSASSGSGSLTGTYSISGNGAATKTITVTFTNFNTDNDESATKSVTFNVDVPSLTSYTVKYNTNGGSGTFANQTKWLNQTLKLHTETPTRTGYTFKGWATTSTATTATYAAGANYTTNAAVTLYAVWQPYTYKITFDANGGLGAPSAQTKTYGKALTLSSVKPTRTNFTFKGWATSSTAATANYQPGDIYEANKNSNATLYAVWGAAYTKPRIKNIVVERVAPVTNDQGSTVGFNYSDEGTYLRICFDWETDKTFSEAVVEWKTTEAASYADEDKRSVTEANSAAGSDFYEIVGDGEINPDVGYMVRVTVRDELDSTALLKVIEQSSLIAYKVHPPASAGGEEMFETLFPLKMSGGFYCNKLLTSAGAGVNVDDFKTPGFFMSVNNSAGTYSGLPDYIGNTTFTFEVLSAGAEGQVMQRITTCSKADPIECIRHYYQGSWGDWIITHKIPSVVLYEREPGTNLNLALKYLGSNKSVADFKYIEIFFTDNNNVTGGYTKVYSPNKKYVSLSIIDASSTTNTHIRRTNYYIEDFVITPQSSANYVRINGNAGATNTGVLDTGWVRHATNPENFIYITRVVGWW